MTLATDDFRRQVVRRATERPRFPTLTPLGKAKVDDVTVTVLIKDEIFGFQVAIGDFLLVDGLKGGQDSGA